ncbi:MAG TPA: hypothetical protein VJX31_01790 [Casimicrobiaceae bacterium]|nr:hypothetical protein [Casimicrobiaceae bacterium]
MTVDDGAPIRATLLPTVTLAATQATSEANPAKMTIADTAPIDIVLLPTVHVTAQQEPTLATTLLPTVRVTPGSTALLESMEIAASDAGAVLPVIDDASPSTTIEPPLGLRARSMPR